MQRAEHFHTRDAPGGPEIKHQNLFLSLGLGDKPTQTVEVDPVQLFSVWLGGNGCGWRLRWGCGLLPASRQSGD